jgi:hypothetical protein
VQGNTKIRSIKYLVVPLLISTLLLALLGVGGVLWFAANRGSETLGPTSATDTPGTASVNLAWDRSPANGVTGYRVLFGTEPRNYTDSATVGNEAKATLMNLRRGTRYYIVVVAIDASGNESAPSNEIDAVTPK